MYLVQWCDVAHNRLGCELKKNLLYIVYICFTETAKLWYQHQKEGTYDFKRKWWSNKWHTHIIDEMGGSF